MTAEPARETREITSTYRDPLWLGIVEAFDRPDAIKLARKTWDDFANLYQDDPDARWRVTLFSVSVFAIGQALQRLQLKVVHAKSRKPRP